MVAVIFLSVSAVLFFSVVFLFGRAELRQFFSSLPLFLALVMPALSMRLIAEEQRRGTYEILVTLPVKTSDVIIAKFFGVWIVGMTMVLPTLLFALSINIIGKLDWGPVVGGYFGTALLIAAYSAVGVFASSLARSETVALILGLLFCLFFALIESFLILLPGGIVTAAEFLSASNHFSNFAQGLLDSRSIIYFISVSVLFLFMANQRLRNMR